MIIRNIDDTPMSAVKMDGVSGASMAIMVGRSDGAPNFALRQFRVEPGGHTPHHAHDYEHEVYVVAGSGTAHLSGEDRSIKGGDVLFIPADEPHQFRADRGGELRFLCVVPVDRNCGDPVPGS